MLNLSLTAETMQNIEYSTGISFSQIEKLDALSIDKLIEKKIKKPLTLNYSERDKRLPSRGGVFLALRRYIKMSDINKKLRKF